MMVKRFYPIAILFSFFLIYACQPSPIKMEMPIVKHKLKKKKPSKQARIDGRIEQEFEMTKDPATGTVPKKRLRKARNYTEQLLNRRAAIAGVTWDERGPNNVGGRTRAILFDPNDANGTKVFAAGVTGGIWTKADASDTDESWTLVSDNTPNIGVVSMTYDPSSTMTMYAATGELFGTGSNEKGEGVLKSTDGGANWIQLSSTLGSDFEKSSKIICLPNGDILHANTLGIQKSTNGGSTWTALNLSNISGSKTITDLERASNGDLYAGTNAGRVIKSTDAGTSWTTVLDESANTGRIELAVAPNDNTVIYAVGKLANSGNSQNDISWFKKSSDSGVNWPSQNIPMGRDPNNGCAANSYHFTRGQAFYDLILLVDPNNANTLIAGGIDIHRSLDGGSTWTDVSNWTSNCSLPKVHADIHAFVVDENSTNDNAVMVGTDGGVYYSPNIFDEMASPTFDHIVKDYNVTQYYDLSIHPDANIDYIIAGAQDNGTQRYTSEDINSTEEINGGDGAFNHISDDGMVQITSYIYHDYSVSNDGGATFTNQTHMGSADFINYTDYDSGDNILYCSNGNGTYTRWNNPSTLGNSFDNVSVPTMNTDAAKSILISPNVDHRIYIGTDEGTLYSINNAHTGSTKSGADVTLLFDLGTLATLRGISVEVGNEDHILICFSNYGVNSVYESINGGTSWTNIENNLPDMPIRDILIDPSNGDRAFLATEIGVWTTDNLSGAATDWQPTNGGLANVRVDQLDYRAADNLIGAASHGRGLFTTESLTKLIRLKSTTVSANEAGANDGPGECMMPYTTINLTAKITYDPSTDITVNLVLDDNSTATEDADYEVDSDQIVFTSGGDLEQDFIINVFDDAIIEGDELLIFDLEVVANTDGATAKATADSLTITIIDNDNDPAIPTVGVSILKTDFDGGLPAGWSFSNVSGGDWQYVTTSSNSSIFFGTPIASSTQSNGWIVFPSDFYGADGITENADVNLPVIDCSNYTNVKFNFEQFFRHFSADLTRIMVSSDNVNFTPYMVSNNDNLAPSGITTNPEAVSVDISATADGQSTVYIKINWMGDYDYFWQIDDVNIIGDFSPLIETVANETKSSSVLDGETAHFYTPEGDIIASVSQTGGSTDIGCVTVTVETSGTGKTALAYDNTYAVSDKTINISGDNDGDYTVKLYYTNAEMVTWGSESLNLNVIKSSTPLASATVGGVEIKDNAIAVQNTALGGYIYEVSFTGFSSFALTDAPANMPCSVYDGETFVYVDDGAAANGNGLAWTSAFNDLQAAIDVVCLCPNLTTVRVAAGNYSPTKDATGIIPTDARDKTFYFNKDITLLGGFAGNAAAPDNSDITLRNFSVNPSILNGDLLGDDGSDFFNNSDNCKNVVKVGASSSTSILDGFTIRGGNHTHGSGLDSEGSIQIINAEIKDCFGSNNGSAVVMTGSGKSVVLENVDIHDNSSDEVLTSNGVLLTIKGTVYIRQD